MKKFMLIVAALGLTLCTESFAVSLPDSFNPWLREPATSTAVDMDEGEAAFLDAMKQGVLYFRNRSNYEVRDVFKRKLSEASAKGSIKAKLIESAHFNGPDAISAFRMVDQSNDPKLLYEVGKMMQLYYLLCLNVLDDNGSSSREEHDCYVQKYQEGRDNEATKILTQKHQDRFFGYILKSANMGYPPAQYEIAYLMMKGGDNLPLNAMELVGMRGTKSEDWLKKSANSGNPEAVLLLGSIQKEAQAKADEIAREAAFEKDHEDTKPKCVNVTFTGIAAAGDPKFIGQVLASSNIEDTLARNLISCQYQGGGYYGYLMGAGRRRVMATCNGVGYFKKKRAEIVDWSRAFYTIQTDLDFDTGRKPAELYIQRRDAKCIK
jgi:TPR repeat protein